MAELTQPGDSPGFLLNQAVLALNGAHDRALAALGVTGAQWTVIYLLHEDRARTVNELARAIGADSGATSRLVGRLVDKGLVVRDGEPGATRRTPLALSEEVQRSYPRMRATVAGTLARLTDGIPAESLAQLGGTLQMIIDNAGRPTAAAQEQEKRTTSTSLDGKVVVAPGGTGNVGEGIVRAFLRAGATVVVPSRSQSRLDELNKLIGPEPGGNLQTVAAGYSTFAEADHLAEKIVTDHGRVDHVVASVGGWWMGKALWQIGQDDWQKVFVDVATSHMALARSFVPRLAEGGSYTTVAGFSGRKPYPAAGIVSMQGAAQLMMREALSAELRGQRRVNDLILGPVINRSRPGGDANWLTSDQVGQAAVGVARTPAITDEHVILDTTDDLKRELARMNV
jgi:3-oxoacyl-[acyl-carrier protein] reductase